MTKISLIKGKTLKKKNIQSDPLNLRQITQNLQNKRPLEKSLKKIDQKIKTNQPSNQCSQEFILTENNNKSQKNGQPQKTLPKSLVRKNKQFQLTDRPNINSGQKKLTRSFHKHKLSASQSPLKNKINKSIHYSEKQQKSNQQTRTEISQNCAYKTKIDCLRQKPFIRVK